MMRKKKIASHEHRPRKELRKDLETGKKRRGRPPKFKAETVLKARARYKKAAIELNESLHVDYPIGKEVRYYSQSEKGMPCTIVDHGIQSVRIRTEGGLKIWIDYHWLEGIHGYD